jgi:DMSO/TMAO reductase YedYZ molybdopterin-dependent catalytic subunit
MFRRIGEMFRDWRRPQPDDVAPLTSAELEALLVDESKLTRSKQQWVQEQRFMKEGPRERSTERLPPGQHLTKSFPVLDLGIHPVVSTDDWRLELAGEVEKPGVLDWAEFNALPTHAMTVDIHCVTAWSRYDNDWIGVSTQTLLELCQPRPTATAVMIEGYDGYTTNLTLADFLAPQCVVAHSWSGEPLTVEHGGPARLVIPHLYFWKSAKWIRKITFMEREERGYWEVGGYHVRGDPWMQNRYRIDEPLD